MPPLQWSPSELTFDGVKPGCSYVQQLAFTNPTDSALHFVLKPSAAQRLTVEPAQVHLEPGAEVRVRVQLCTKQAIVRAAPGGAGQRDTVAVTSTYFRRNVAVTWRMAPDGGEDEDEGVGVGVGAGAGAGAMGQGKEKGQGRPVVTARAQSSSGGGGRGGGAGAGHKEGVRDDDFGDIDTERAPGGDRRAHGKGGAAIVRGREPKRGRSGLGQGPLAGRGVGTSAAAGSGTGSGSGLVPLRAEAKHVPGWPAATDGAVSYASDDDDDDADSVGGGGGGGGGTDYDASTLADAKGHEGELGRRRQYTDDADSPDHGAQRGVATRVQGPGAAAALEEFEEYQGQDGAHNEAQFKAEAERHGQLENRLGATAQPPAGIEAPMYTDTETGTDEDLDYEDDGAAGGGELNDKIFQLRVELRQERAALAAANRLHEARSLKVLDILRAKDRELEQLRSDGEGAGAWRERAQKAELALAQAQAELQAAQSEKEQAVAELERIRTRSGEMAREHAAEVRELRSEHAADSRRRESVLFDMAEKQAESVFGRAGENVSADTDSARASSAPSPPAAQPQALAQAQEERDAARADAVRERERGVELEEQVSVLLEEVSRLRRTVEEAGPAERAVKHADIQAASNTVESESALQAANAQNATVSAELSAARRRVHQLEGELSAKNAELDASRSQLQQTAAKLSDSIASRAAAKGDSQDFAAANGADHAITGDANDANDSDAIELRERVRKLEALLSQARSTVEGLEVQQRKSQEQQQLEHRQEVDQLQGQIKQLEQQLERARSERQHDQAQSAVEEDSMRLQTQEKEQRVQQLESLLSQARGTISSLETTQVETQEHQQLEHRQHLDHVRSEMKQLEQQLERARTERSQEMPGHAEELERSRLQVQQLEQQLEQTRAELQQQQQHRKRREHLPHRISSTDRVPAHVNASTTADANSRHHCWSCQFWTRARGRKRPNREGSNAGTESGSASVQDATLRRIFDRDHDHDASDTASSSPDQTIASRLEATVRAQAAELARARASLASEESARRSEVLELQDLLALRQERLARAASEVRRATDSGRVREEQLRRAVRVLSGRGDAHAKAADALTELASARAALSGAAAEVESTRAELTAARAEAASERRQAAMAAQQAAAARAAASLADDSNNLPGFAGRDVLLAVVDEGQRCLRRVRELEAELVSARQGRRHQRASSADEVVGNSSVFDAAVSAAAVATVTRTDVDDGNAANVPDAVGADADAKDLADRALHAVETRRQEQRAQLAADAAMQADRQLQAARRREHSIREAHAAEIAEMERAYSKQSSDAAARLAAYAASAEEARAAAHEAECRMAAKAKEAAAAKSAAARLRRNAAHEADERQAEGRTLRSAARAAEREGVRLRTVLKEREQQLRVLMQALELLRKAGDGADDSAQEHAESLGSRVISLSGELAEAAAVESLLRRAAQRARDAQADAEEKQAEAEARAERAESAAAAAAERDVAKQGRSHTESSALPSQLAALRRAASDANAARREAEHKLDEAQRCATRAQTEAQDLARTLEDEGSRHVAVMREVRQAAAASTSALQREVLQLRAVVGRAEQDVGTNLTSVTAPSLQLSIEHLRAELLQLKAQQASRRTGSAASAPEAAPAAFVAGKLAELLLACDAERETAVLSSNTIRLELETRAATFDETEAQAAQARRECILARREAERLQRELAVATAENAHHSKGVIKALDDEVAQLRSSAEESARRAEAAENTTASLRVEKRQALAHALVAKRELTQMQQAAGTAQRKAMAETEERVRVERDSVDSQVRHWLDSHVDDSTGDEDHQVSKLKRHIAIAKVAEASLASQLEAVMRQSEDKNEQIASLQLKLAKQDEALICAHQQRRSEAEAGLRGDADGQGQTSQPLPGDTNAAAGILAQLRREILDLKHAARRAEQRSNAMHAALQRGGGMATDENGAGPEVNGKTEDVNANDAASVGDAADRMIALQLQVEDQQQQIAALTHERTRLEVQAQAHVLARSLDQPQPQPPPIVVTDTQTSPASPSSSASPSPSRSELEHHLLAAQKRIRELLAEVEAAKSSVATNAPNAKLSFAEVEVWELKGLYYQVLGHAWDHEVKDFKVVYRPLYHCESKDDRFEAHTMAVSHFSRWEEKFTRVSTSGQDSLAAMLPREVRSLLLPGPFVKDPEWRFAARTVPVDSTRTGLGSRWHEHSDSDHSAGDTGVVADTGNVQYIDTDNESGEVNTVLDRCLAQAVRISALEEALAMAQAERDELAMAQEKAPADSEDSAGDDNSTSTAARISGMPPATPGLPSELNNSSTAPSPFPPLDARLSPNPGAALPLNIDDDAASENGDVDENKAPAEDLDASVYADAEGDGDSSAANSNASDDAAVDVQEQQQSPHADGGHDDQTAHEEHHGEDREDTLRRMSALYLDARARHAEVSHQLELAQQQHATALASMVPAAALTAREAQLRSASEHLGRLGEALVHGERAVEEAEARAAQAESEARKERGRAAEQQARAEAAEAAAEAANAAAADAAAKVDATLLEHRRQQADRQQQQEEDRRQQQEREAEQSQMQLQGEREKKQNEQQQRQAQNDQEQQQQQQQQLMLANATAAAERERANAAAAAAAEASESQASAERAVSELRSHLEGQRHVHEQIAAMFEQQTALLQQRLVVALAAAEKASLSAKRGRSRGRGRGRGTSTRRRRSGSAAAREGGNALDLDGKGGDSEDASMPRTKAGDAVSAERVAALEVQLAQRDAAVHVLRQELAELEKGRVHRVQQHVQEQAVTNTPPLAPPAPPAQVGVVASGTEPDSATEHDRLDIATMSERMAALRTELALERARVASEQQKSVHAEAAASDMTSKLRAATRRTTTMKDKARAIARELAESRDMSKRAQAEIERLQTNLDRVQREYLSPEDKERMKERLKAARSEQKRAREDALRDAQALKAVKAERENDAETVREWQKLLKQRKAETARARHDAGQKMSQIKDLRTQLEAARVEVVSLESKCAELARKLKGAQPQQTRKKNTEVLKQRLDEQNSRYDRLDAEAQARERELTEKVSGLKRELSRKKSQVKTLKRQLAEAKQAFAELESLGAEAESAAESRVAVAESRVHDMTLELEAGTKMRQDLHAQRDEQATELGRQQQQHQARVEEHARMEAALQQELQQHREQQLQRQHTEQELRRQLEQANAMYEKVRREREQGMVEGQGQVAEQASPEVSTGMAMQLDPARVSPIANMLELSNAEMASLLASGGHHSSREAEVMDGGGAMDVAAALGMGAEEIDIVEGTYTGRS